MCDTTYPARSLQELFDEISSETDDVTETNSVDSSYVTEEDEYIPTFQQTQWDCHAVLALPLFDAPIAMDECSICYEGILMVNCAITRCGHAFHASCMFNAVINGLHSCPLCRVQLTPVLIDNDQMRGRRPMIIEEEDDSA